MKSLPRLRATSIGLTAARLLAHSGAAGRVLGVVSRAVYLESDRGHVCWLGDASLPAHGRSLLAPLPADLPPLTGRWSAAAGLLSLPGGLGIDLTEAKVWFPPSIDRRHLPSPSLLVARATAALAAARLVPPADGLAPLLPLVVDCTIGDQQVCSGQSNGLPAALAAEGVRAVAQACRRRETRSALGAAEPLLGLGVGLTPAGDDFVGGLLFALHHLADAYPQLVARHDEAAAALVARARAGTNVISYTILADLAAGHGPAPLHDLLFCLLQGATVPQSALQLRRLVGIGHTSGWDVLLGFLCGLLALDTPTIAS